MSVLKEINKLVHKKGYCVMKCRYDESNYESVSLVSFHSFPKNEKLKELWLEAMQKKNWTPPKKAKLCSLHFEDRFIDSFEGKARLRCSAIPTIFNHKDERLIRMVRRNHNLQIVKSLSTDAIAGYSNKSFKDVIPPDVPSPPGPSHDKNEISPSRTLSIKRLSSPPSASSRSLNVTPNSAKRIQIPVSMETHAASTSDLEGITRLDELQSKSLKIKQQERETKALRYDCRKNIRAVKNLREAKRRLKKKVQNLRSLLRYLENKDLISPEISVLLLNSGGCCEELLKL